MSIPFMMAELTTSRAFTAASRSYDDDFDTHPSAQRLRRIVLREYLRHFKPGDRVLELNCGTGTDAIGLARHGISVLATDASDGMVDQCKRKVETQRLDHLVAVRRLAFSELSTLAGEKFDGIVSNMGGLNCIPRLSGLARDVHGLVRSGGALIVTVMSDRSLWEIASHLARGRVTAAFRRWSGGPLSVPVHGFPVPTYYHSPSSVRNECAQWFELESVMGLNVITPPPSSRSISERFGSLNRMLEFIEDRLPRNGFFARLGDHFTCVLKRR